MRGSLCTGNSGRKPPITVQKMGLCTVYRKTNAYGTLCFCLCLFFSSLCGFIWFTDPKFLGLLQCLLENHMTEPMPLNWSWGIDVKLTSNKSQQSTNHAYMSGDILWVTGCNLSPRDTHVQCNSVIIWTILSKTLTLNIAVLICEANIWGLYVIAVLNVLC